MKPLQIIIDTNVIVSAIRSRQGASYKLLLLLGVDKRFEINLSTALLLEYEEQIHRQAVTAANTDDQVNDFLDFICSTANEHKIYFRWRPLLPDADDEFVLDLAIVANADYILTYNIKDFEIAGDFNIKVITPLDFLRILGEIK